LGTITYPSSTDSTHNIVNGGLLIINALSVTSSTRTMVAFGVACKHNLSVGTTVKTGTTGYDGSYDVVRLGLDNGDLIDYYLLLIYHQQNYRWGVLEWLGYMVRF
jgi:hypothetical protein